VPRILLIIVLALAAGQAGGVLWFGGDTCSDDCTDGKQCPPQCPTCTCAGTVVPSMPTPCAIISTPPTVELVVEFATPRVFTVSPDPREILHVPRSCAV
jgi:hypothetical protein